MSAVGTRDVASGMVAVVVVVVGDGGGDGDGRDEASIGLLEGSPY